jgi:hypothetical protein
MTTTPFPFESKQWLYFRRYLEPLGATVEALRFISPRIGHLLKFSVVAERNRLVNVFEFYLTAKVHRTGVSLGVFRLGRSASMAGASDVDICHGWTQVADIHHRHRYARNPVEALIDRIDDYKLGEVHWRYATTMVLAHNSLRKRDRYQKTIRSTEQYGRATIESRTSGYFTTKAFAHTGVPSYSVAIVAALTDDQRGRLERFLHQLLTEPFVEEKDLVADWWTHDEVFLLDAKWLHQPR